MRVVFDLDRLAPIEVVSDLASGDIAVRLHDTDLGEELLPLPDEIAAMVEILERGPSVAEPLAIQVRVGRPLVMAEHFAVRQISDLVLEIERKLLPGSVSMESPDDGGPPAIAWAADGSSQVIAREGALGASPESVVSSLPTPIGPGMVLMNLPPDHMLDSSLERPRDFGLASDLSDGASNRARRLLSRLDNLGGSLPRGLELSAEHSLPPISSGSTGPNAPRDLYESTPPDLEVLPPAIARAHSQNIQRRDQARNVALIQSWIAKNPDSPGTERMLFLLAETRHTVARHRQMRDLGGATAEADWFTVINDFRYALRRHPDSKWAPLAWLRIHDCYMRMGWLSEALGALESFQRAETHYSVGAILIMRARLLERLGREEEEMTVLAQHLEADPEGPDIAEVYQRMGRLFRRRGQRLPAYTAFRRAWELDQAFVEDSPERLADVIESAFENSDHEWAEQEIEYVRFEFPRHEGNGYLTTLLGLIHLERGDVDKALQSFVEALDYPQTPRSLQALVRLADQGRTDRREGIERPGVTHEAYLNPRAAYQFILDEWPDEDIAQVAHLRLGETMIEDGEALNGLRQLGQGVEQWPESRLRPSFENALGDALHESVRDALQRGDDLLALRIHSVYGRDTGDNPLRPDELWGLAQVCERQGLWSELGEITSDLLVQWEEQEAPALPWEEVLHSHVGAMRHRRRLPEALETIQESAEAFPSGARHTDLLFARVGILHELDRWEETIDAADEALAVGGGGNQRATALFHRADATKRTLGPDAAVPRHIEALHAFQATGQERLSVLIPYEIIFELADSLYQTANWNRAARVYGELADSYPDAAEARIFHYRLGQCLAHMGRFEEARAELDTLAAEDSPPLWRNLADQIRTDLQWLDLYPEIFTIGGVVQ
jgi:tetratricopeptide (TPR) repeat protein